MEPDEIQQFYLRSLISEVTGWSDPKARLGKALARNEFVLYGQRVLRIAPGGDQRAHIEIFIRLQEEERNLTPPGAFLPILEYYGLGPQLDRWVVRNVLAWCRSYTGIVGVVAHVNLSGGTITDAGFPDFVKSELAAVGLGGDALCFEIPDVDILYGSDALPFARRLREADCYIAVGSLGRENMSFRPVKNVAADFVKLDGSLVRDLVTDELAVVKVRAIVRACQAFSIQTVAQYVEDSRVLDKVRSLKVDFAQGYGIAMPEPLEKLGLA